MSRAVPSFELTPATIEVDSVRGSGVNGASVWSRRKEYREWMFVENLWCVGFFWKKGEWLWQVVI